MVDRAFRGLQESGVGDTAGDRCGGAGGRGGDCPAFRGAISARVEPNAYAPGCRAS